MHFDIIALKLHEIIWQISTGALHLRPHLYYLINTATNEPMITRRW